MSDASSYQRPTEDLAAIIDAPPTPSTSLSPDRRRLAVLALPNLPPIDELARPELRLAGARLDPQLRDQSRLGHFTGIELLDIESGHRLPVIGLPEGARLRRLRWSPDSRHLAFTRVTEQGAEIWLACTTSGQARRLTDPILTACAGSPLRWMPDSTRLLCRLVPEEQGPAPVAPSTPPGPIIEENLGQKAPALTWQDLLSSPHDEDLFDHYMTCQLAMIDLDGAISPIGQPGLLTMASPSPDGTLLLVEVMHRPYSYRVPMGRFPRRLEVWRADDGHKIFELVDLPLAEEIPIGRSAARVGPRAIGWRGDVPATLKWVEAQDGGDPEVEVEIRDHLYTLAAPFDGEPRLMARTALRMGSVIWGRGDLAMVTETWWKTRTMRAWLFSPDDPEAPGQVLFDQSWEDRYNDPGRPLLDLTPSGHTLLRTSGDGRALFFAGAGASPEGNRPFLDRRSLDTGEVTRLWRCSGPWFEAPYELLDTEGQRVLTSRESIEEPPNFFIRDLRDDSLSQITHFPHPTPALKGIQKELVRYKRADGVDLTATLYLPPGYEPGRDAPMPALLWAYPQEFKNAEAAGQVRDSPYRFVRVGWWSPILWVLRGFAVLDDPSMPIIGEGEQEPNDTYIEQLVAGAQAAIDELDRRQVADPRRVAVGGHSYGAFMTANLLAHSELFRAGIARSGAFNRTLTPFGFQAEERTLWQAPLTYFAMSPFIHADRISAPLLLIHGADDNNPGTYPMQSERFYQALKGHGATARLVMLPHESHGYRAHESIMHMIWEMDRWLTLHVVPPTA